MEKKHSVIFSRPLSPKEVDGTKINISINAPLAGLTESHGCLVHIPFYVYLLWTFLARLGKEGSIMEGTLDFDSFDLGANF